MWGTGKGRGAAYTYRHLQDFFAECLVSEEIDPALRYYFLQRTALMGRVVYGKPGRTFFSAPEGWHVTKGNRLECAAESLQGVRITRGDYALLFEAAGDRVWVYADPPYVKDSLARQAHKLYAHSFTLEDHERLAETIRRCSHRVLLSYDDDPGGIVRSLYRDFDLVEEQWVYGGATGAKKKQGRELLIGNYDLRAPEILARLENLGRDAA